MLSAVDQLLLMDGGRPLRAEQPVPPEVVYRQPDMLAAIRLAVQVSGLDEKQVFLPLGINKAQWSRILSGQAHFPENKIERFMDIVGNEIPLR